MLTHTIPHFLSIGYKKDIFAVFVVGYELCTMKRSGGFAAVKLLATLAVKYSAFSRM